MDHASRYEVKGCMRFTGCHITNQLSHREQEPSFLSCVLKWKVGWSSLAHHLMGVQGLTGYCRREKNVHSQLYEKIDLSAWRGETVIVDANGFLFWAIGEYVPLQLLHDLGDFAGDGLVGIRHFIRRYFHDNGIKSIWIHDGSFNPMKFKTQESRREARLTPEILINTFVYNLIATPPGFWQSSPPSFMDMFEKYLKPRLDACDQTLGPGVGMHTAFYALLDELQEQGVSVVRQERTVLEADAYIAQMCLQDESIKAVVSTDSDFLVFNTPFLPLHSIDTRADGISPALYVPRGRFAKVFYDQAISRLEGIATGLTRAEWEAAVPLEAFVRLLPDMATLLGNDYFSPVDPKTRQAKGFVKRVTVVLTATGRQRIGDVTDKGYVSEFLLLCAHNGWLDCEGLLDVGQGGEVAKLLFQQEDRRWEYVQARDQYSLWSGMAHNDSPSSMVRSGLAQQYADFRLGFHFAPFVYAPEAGLPRRISASSLLPLQQFGFPMRNILQQRQVLYELLLYRARERRGEEGEEGDVTGFLYDVDDNGTREPASVLEEHVRLDPKTRKLQDEKQPFKTVVRILVCESEGGLKRQRQRAEEYRARLGPEAEQGPREERKAFLLQTLGYSPDPEWLSFHVASVEGEADAEADADGFTVAVLSLRVLVVAYGTDSDGTLLQSTQRNHEVMEALLYAVALALVCPTHITTGTYYPLRSQRSRDSYPWWLNDTSCPIGLRLRLMAFLTAYRTCLGHVLDLSDVLGRALLVRSPLALSLTHEACQRFASPRGREEAVSEVVGLGEMVEALRVRVAEGIDADMDRYYQAAPDE